MKLLEEDEIARRDGTAVSIEVSCEALENPIKCAEFQVLWISFYRYIGKVVDRNLLLERTHGNL